LVLVNPLFTRLGIPADADTLTGIRRMISEHLSETPHLDFKQKIHNVDDLADDLCALSNTGAAC